MENEIMRSLQERALIQAEKEGRFCPQPTELHCFRVAESGNCQYAVATDKTHEILNGPHRTSSCNNTDHQPCVLLSDPTLRCIFQRTRPPHTSTRPDYLPFKSAESARSIFKDLELPASYFQIADGSPATASSHVRQGARGEPIKFEILAHCVTKQGDWTMAVSHNTATMSTSAFWSVDGRIDSQALIDDLQEFRSYASHPLLIPSIMLSAAFRMAVQRRHSIKSRVFELERAIVELRQSVSPEDHPPALDDLFSLLQSCRKEQTSREGRYDFWSSFYSAVEAGFEYYSALPKIDKKAHADLYQWANMTWKRLESVKARDKDHTLRVDNISALLHSLVQQREIRLQSSIAKTSQRDSKDMKFVALLGSIFLPASLIATILNVPQFQFADGAMLFGAYMGITLPLIALVVVLCMTRSSWVKWRVSRLRTRAIRESQGARKETSALP